ncbi:carotenoid 9,10(9',10')-cleavage dioxygenase 1-like [Cornus florida]|uniref:carotenoid 9,10(9',10')-cleavage dioxygenase 1-like n=1 Tax=Cornus florida TaxID=4283 RepID=UPI00289A9356|nr:carotenoid 9,10(9',10')-cleavage dioxygenase 1-like [Cornus florida]
MAIPTCAFHANCCVQRPSISHRVDHFKTSLFSVFKPLMKELQQDPLQISVSEIIKNTSVTLLDAFADLVFEFNDQPLLPSQSNFAPVEELGKAVLVTNIEGRIPDDFPEGVYLRNGANPLFEGLKSTISMFGRSSHTWVEGEGMLHALYFNNDSSGSWTVFYNNKHVHTETFKLERQRNEPSFLPAIEGDALAILSAHLLNMLRFVKVNKDFSNTNVLMHSGKLYAVAENDLPQEIDILTLETLGNWDVNGAWNRPFTAHPKKAPGTGEMVLMGVDAKKPYFELGVISADGKKLVHKVDLKFNRCTLCHDIGVTQRLMRYDKEGYARIGVMPRYGNAESVQWFEVEPSCVLHILNCYDDGDEVVVLGFRARGSIIPGPDLGLNKFEWFSRGFKPVSSVGVTKDGLFFCRCCEWRLNMLNGECKLCLSLGMAKYGGLAKLYLGDPEHRFYQGKRQHENFIKVEYHKFEKNTSYFGATFVPKCGGSEEDDSWIISFVQNEDTGISQVYIIDTKNFNSEPVAQIMLPCRVPDGFHGAFMSMPFQQ